MKIKRFQNPFIMGIILCGAMLLTIYVGKLFFPDFVIKVAEIESICKIGNYIDTHKWAWYVASSILSLLSYYLICGASCGRKRFNLKEWGIIVLTIAILFLIKEFLPILYTPLNIVSIVLLPTIFKGKLIPAMTTFSAITVLQAITLEIRGLKYNIVDFNFATLLILMIDVYILEFLLFFTFNFKKGE